MTVSPWNIPWSSNEPKLALADARRDLRPGGVLIGAAIGPYREFGPESGPGLPSGANLQLAQDLGRYVNSFLWKGDPPR